MAKFKKGQKVIRYSGYSSCGYPTMRIGDVGTVENNQRYPGIVDLKEFPGGHDPGRLIRIDQLSPKIFKAFTKLVKQQRHESTDVRNQILAAFLDGYLLGSK